MCASTIPASEKAAARRVSERTVAGPQGVIVAIELLPLPSNTERHRVGRLHSHYSSLVFFAPAASISLKDLQCPVCRCVVDGLVETVCRKLVCAECMPNHTLTSISCSFCNVTHENSFTPASDVVLKVLGTLLLQCDQPSCTAVVQLQNLKSHLESGCKWKAPSYSPSKLTVGQLLSRPLQSPPNAMEQKAATCILKRMMASISQDHPAGSCVVKMPNSWNCK